MSRTENYIHLLLLPEGVTQSIYLHIYNLTRPTLCSRQKFRSVKCSWPWSPGDCSFSHIRLLVSTSHKCFGFFFYLSYILEFMLKDPFFQKNSEGLTCATQYHLINLLGFDFYLMSALMSVFVACFFLFFFFSLVSYKGAANTGTTKSRCLWVTCSSVPWSRAGLISESEDPEGCSDLIKTAATTSCNYVVDEKCHEDFEGLPCTCGHIASSLVMQISSLLLPPGLGQISAGSFRWREGKLQTHGFSGAGRSLFFSVCAGLTPLLSEKTIQFLNLSRTNWHNSCNVIA